MIGVLPGLALNAVAFLVAGAAVLSLVGSDTAPTTGLTDPHCERGITVTKVIVSAGRVTSIEVSGDMTRCSGQTMRVAVTRVKKPSTEFYGVYRFATGSELVSLTFDETEGAFRDTQPLPVDGTLEATGLRVAPEKDKDLGDVNVTIAQIWQ